LKPDESPQAALRLLAGKQGRLAKRDVPKVQILWFEQPFTYSVSYGFAYSSLRWVGASCQRPLCPHCRILLQSIHRTAEKKFEISMVWDGNRGLHMSFPVFAAECGSADHLESEIS
jgi:hypothetical protein